MSKQLLTVALAVVLGLAFGAPIEAATLAQGLVPGVVNTIEDQDREAYVDANNDGLFNVGDVFVGFVRLDDFAPSGLGTNNQVYAVFSNQITAITESPLGSGQVFVSLGVTTVAGLTLQDITSDGNTTGGMFAVYDAAAPFSTNLINASAPGATSINDDIDLILSEGTLRLVVTVIGANGDFLTVDQNAGFDTLPGGSNDGIVGLGGGITVGSFTGGLSVIFNNTGFTYAPTVGSVDPLTGLQTSQVAVASGAIRGSADDGQQAVFTNINGNFAQCSPGGVQTACGFITDADFLVAPLAVPLPASLLLLGGGLLGTAAVGTLRRRR